MNLLVVSPVCFPIAISNNLTKCNTSPWKPHQPAMHSEDTLCSVLHGTTASCRVQLNIEKAVILPMVWKTTIWWIERVNHIDLLIKWYCVRINRCSCLDRSIWRENRWTIGLTLHKTCLVCVCYDLWVMIPYCVALDLVGRISSCFPDYHVCATHGGSIPHSKEWIVPHSRNKFDLLSRPIVSYVYMWAIIYCQHAWRRQRIP